MSVEKTMKTQLSHKGIPFQALVVRVKPDDSYGREVEDKEVGQLPDGDVLVRVRYSSLNYKDALSASGNKGVTRKYPHTPGIDAAGIVQESADNRFREGEEVLVCGYDLGMNTDGGFGQFIRVPGDWVMPKPQGLSALQCMQIGTAGFTAAQCVTALTTSGLCPDKGRILVTGATGGVGSFAVALLYRLGFTVTAVTGKQEARPFLSALGASDFLDRTQATVGAERMLLRERWAGVIDTVGGDILATAIKSTGYDGTVACCGNAMAAELALNVYPFILRAVKLQGIDSAQCPMARREQIWKRLATDWKVPGMNDICRTVSLHDIIPCIEQMLAGKLTGRIVINLGGEG